jgi:outer membrane lipoprotein-sorting protein
MKWLLILAVLAGATSSFAQASGAQNTVQPYSATIWTTMTFQSKSGSTHIAMQRTVVTRDGTGKWQTAVYRPTQGPQQNISSPLDHVFTGSTPVQPQSLTPAQSSGETLTDDLDLGTQTFAGLPAVGRRRIFRSVGRQPEATHTLETWFSPTLGVIVHSESRNFSGTTVVTDLSDLQLSASASQQTSQ